MPLKNTDLEALLAPLAGDAPCGAALDFDPRFQALQAAATGKPERQWGDRIYAAEDPDWPAVDAQALALAAVSRDLRVAVLLLRSGTRLQGYGAAATGLRLVQQLLQRHWDHVHPELDHEDGDDPTMRLSALAPLFAREVLPSELRAAALAPERGSLRLRDLELGLGRAEADPGETVPTEAGTLEALAGLLQRHPEVADAAQAAFEAAQAIVAELEGRLGAAQVPTAAPLLDLLRLPVDAIARLRAPAGAATVSGTAAG
ncbi:MAG: type VI secretion system ImpA family N-terminal domain-containing protein, partial [Burkholderiales bacterium]|nr:type VI secretion system ImpA family N-terminal domain-containing protein [Burkholderiales bacterium]